MSNPDVEWAEVTDPAWTPKLVRSTVGLVVRFTGACPRCDHQTSTDFPRIVPGLNLTRDEPEPFTMYCVCGHPHLHHPDGDNGCGAYWRYEAEL
jgi:hypothetical protein